MRNGSRSWPRPASRKALAFSGVSSPRAQRVSAARGGTPAASMAARA
ncbi:MAG: hypothetical protein V8S11_08685 [Flavonifractor plautii]